MVLSGAQDYINASHIVVSTLQYCYICLYVMFQKVLCWQLYVSCFTGLLENKGEAVLQDDHSPGKPGQVRKFQSGQGKIGENEKVRGTEVIFIVQLN